ncbi:exported hypothetical protein [Candidatus Sulfotelmatomonas gaucii]|uniref:Uncharacterized protein n=1 Tax=Candidatus Sulfuritelmatomonas gaucii TaxID=2043161 RepID=A0A2N9M3K6_9BACT|nr:exported hypothetical protein [Candidatus Sulfotelmatomonas gaucii]
MTLHCITAAVLSTITAFLFSQPSAHAQPPPLIAQKIAPGVWFLPGDASKGYCNNIVLRDEGLPHRRRCQLSRPRPRAGQRNQSALSQAGPLRLRYPRTSRSRLRQYRVDPGRRHHVRLPGR